MLRFLTFVLSLLVLTSAKRISRDSCPTDFPASLCSHDFTVLEMGAFFRTFQFGCNNTLGIPSFDFLPLGDKSKAGRLSFMYVNYGSTLTFLTDTTQIIIGKVHGFCSPLIDYILGAEYYCNKQLTFIHKDQVIGSIVFAGNYPNSMPYFQLSIIGGTGIHANAIGIIRAHQFGVFWRYHVRTED